MNEQVFIASNGVKLKFKHQYRKYDYNHLLFVFSGFNSPLPGEYDFAKVLNQCPCDVIWISDDFEGMHAYYLCIGMDFKVEEAISEFMNFKREENELSWMDITVAGASKGGTAALYYGLKLNISNIVMCVPQVFIGSNVDLSWKSVAKHMMCDNYTRIQMKFLDNLIPQLLRKDSFLHKNIYLITSEQDVQYKVHIEPILNDLAKYENFNFIKSYSLLVREHKDVMRHHIPIFLSIIYALSSEAIPKFNNGRVDYYGSQKVTLSTEEVEPIVDLINFNILDKKLYLNGIGILHGWNTENYSDIDYELILEGKNQYILKLAKKHLPRLTRDYYKKSAVVYDKCFFTTHKHQGIDISEVESGNYTLHLRIHTSKHNLTSSLLSSKIIYKEDEYFTFECNDKISYLVIK